MRIGIVGGGISGLVAAWLLSEDHEVVLYERDGSLGGNARSVLVGDPGSTCWATPGSTHILPGSYPLTVRLLAHLAVATRRLPVEITVVDEARRVRWLSPRRHRIGGIAERGDSAGWARLLASAWRLERRGDWFVTWQQFVDGIGGRTRFIVEVGEPVVAAFWGVRPSQMGSLSARALLAYLTRQTPGANSWVPGWPVVCADGTGRLVEALATNTARADVRVCTSVEALGRSASKVVVESSGGRETFDRVVLAVPPWTAGCLAGDEALHSVQSLHKTPTVIAIHTSDDLVPRDPRLRSAAMVIVGDDRSQLTTLVGHTGGRAVYRSWVSSGAAPTSGVLMTAAYTHVAPTPQLFSTQAAVRAWQGTGGCWLAGSWTRDVDSIESAVRSALLCAKGIDPSASRVRWLAQHPAPSC